MALFGFGIEGDAGGVGDLGDEGAEAAVGVDPVDATGVAEAKAVGVFDGGLGFAEAAGAGDDADALDDGGGAAAAVKGVVDGEEVGGAADEFIGEGTVGEAVLGGEGVDGRKLGAVERNCSVRADDAAEGSADLGIGGVEEGGGGNIQALDVAEEAREGGEMIAGVEREREEFGFAVGEGAGAFDFDPRGGAEIGGEDEDDGGRLIEGLFEGADPVVAPGDGFGVEEAGDAVAAEAAIEFADERFVGGGVAEEDAGHPRFLLRLIYGNSGKWRLALKPV